METKVAYRTDPLTELSPLFASAIAKTHSADELLTTYAARWGSADIYWQHVGGRGPRPFITDHNGHAQALRPWYIPGCTETRYTEVE